MRRRRLVRGVVVARSSRSAPGPLFTAVAMANELALRDHPPASSRFGPTDRDASRRVRRADRDRPERAAGAPPDGRPRRPADRQRRPRRRPRRDDFRGWPTRRRRRSWAPRRGPDRDEAWVRQPFSGLAAERARRRRATAPSTSRRSRPRWARRSATRPSSTASTSIEGARATHCRIAIDGPTFRRAFPAVAWLVGDDELGRWRGELDYWVFARRPARPDDRQRNGDAGGIRDGALQGTIRVNLSATSRGSDLDIVPPGP